MSHFVVLVVGDDYEEVLEHYNENTEVEPYIDKTPEELLETFNEAKKHMLERIEKEPDYTMSEFVELTLSLDKPDAQWLKNWSGQTLDEGGNALSTYNPDSKWDWYELGGRWTGAFPLKNGSKAGKVGLPGVFGNKPKTGRVDQARICDIDWDLLNKEAADRAGEEWDNLFKPYDPKTCMWKESYVISQKELHLKLYGTKEEYVRRRGIWTPYAFVSEQTGWLSPGEMGWFGLSSDDTEDRDEFCQQFPDLLKQFDEEEIISSIDCHI